MVFLKIIPPAGVRCQPVKPRTQQNNAFVCGKSFSRARAESDIPFQISNLLQGFGVHDPESKQLLISLPEPLVKLFVLIRKTQEFFQVLIGNDNGIVISATKILVLQKINLSFDTGDRQGEVPSYQRPKDKQVIPKK